MVFIQINNDLILRDIETTDFQDYLHIMYQFTNYNYNIKNEEFINTLNNFRENNLCNIIVIFSTKQNKIIGAGSIYKIIKLHNNPIGQIEDVFIDETYRTLGYGKLIIHNLVQIGISKFNCYKIILNCLKKNEDFYKKCNFENVGYEMRYMS
jgi:RimJ/RimL family protein N-acetyltransferase